MYDYNIIDYTIDDSRHISWSKLLFLKNKC